MNYKDYFNGLEGSSEYLKAEQELKVILDLADEILRLRMERGWSQAELAERVGTKQANISRLEGGLNNPSVTFLQKVAKAFDTSLSVRFEKTEHPEVEFRINVVSRSEPAILVENWPHREKTYDRWTVVVPQEKR